MTHSPDPASSPDSASPPATETLPDTLFSARVRGGSQNEKRIKLREELETNLPHFTGTEEYHRLRYPWLRRDFLLTDGAKYLADKGGVIGSTAYWLIDIIASHQRNQKVAAEGFQTWRLYVNHQPENAVELDPEQVLRVGAAFSKLAGGIQALGITVPEEPQPPAMVVTWKKMSRLNEALVTCDDGNGQILVTQEVPFADFALDEISLYVTNDDFNGIVVMLPSEY